MPVPPPFEFRQTESSSRISHLGRAFRRNFTEAIVKPESVTETSRSRTSSVNSGNRHAVCVGIPISIARFSPVSTNRDWRDRC
jgi:hypothetical protein